MTSAVSIETTRALHVLGNFMLAVIARAVVLFGSDRLAAATSVGGERDQRQSRPVPTRLGPLTYMIPPLIILVLFMLYRTLLRVCYVLIRVPQ